MSQLNEALGRTIPSLDLNFVQNPIKGEEDSLPFSIPDPFWNIIAAATPEAEREEIRRCIGERVLTRNEDVFHELESLAEIWSAVYSETEQLERSGSSVSDKLDRLSRLRHIPLQSKQNIEESISVLIQNIRAKNATPLICSSKEQRIFDYVQKAATERPRTATNKHGKAVPTMSARPRTAGGVRPSLAAVGQAVGVGTVDAIVTKIRSQLDLEYSILIDLVEEIRFAIEAQDEFSYQLRTAREKKEEVPTIEELMNYGAELQKRMGESERQSDRGRLRPTTSSGVRPPSRTDKGSSNARPLGGEDKRSSGRVSSSVSSSSASSTSTATASSSSRSTDPSTLRHTAAKPTARASVASQSKVEVRVRPRLASPSSPAAARTPIRATHGLTPTSEAPYTPTHTPVGPFSSSSTGSLPRGDRRAISPLRTALTPTPAHTTASTNPRRPGSASTPSLPPIAKARTPSSQHSR